MKNNTFTLAGKTYNLDMLSVSQKVLLKKIMFCKSKILEKRAIDQKLTKERERLVEWLANSLLNDNL